LPPAELPPLLQALDLISQVVGDLLGGKRALQEGGGGGCTGPCPTPRPPRRLLWGAVAVHGHAAAPLVGPRGRVQGVEVEASLQGDTGHLGYRLFYYRAVYEEVLL